ncbi:MAG TPA: NTP transferase domain-containing protein [Acidimicrobiales bacterium]|nr:NTP transferase domain-containing protein [Acidimicrobiales bacterium]
MEVIIAMAGRGSRFADAGWTTPKPLIPVGGVPMYALAVRGLPLDPIDHLVFVALNEQLDSGLAESIATEFGPNASIIALDDVTEGQAVTVLRGLPATDPTRPLLIHNADTVCTFARSELATDADGALVVFEAEGTHWSFARRGEGRSVVEVAEKRRISGWASTGTYWFRSGALFAELAQAALAGQPVTGGEYYVAPLYDDLLRQGGRVEAIEATSVDVLGTPAELDAYLARLAEAASPKKSR